MKVRIHLRHIGASKPQIRFNKWSHRWADGSYHWGTNIVFGWWFLAIRPRDGGLVPYRFFDLGFGRSMKKRRK